MDGKAMTFTVKGTKPGETAGMALQVERGSQIDDSTANAGCWVSWRRVTNR